MVFHKYLDTLASVCSNLEVLFCLFLYICSNVRQTFASSQCLNLRFSFCLASCACWQSVEASLLLFLCSVKGKGERIGRRRHCPSGPQPWPQSLGLESDSAWRGDRNLNRVGRGREKLPGLLPGSGGPPTPWEKILGLIDHPMANYQLIFILSKCHMNLLSP